MSVETGEAESATVGSPAGRSATRPRLLVVTPCSALKRGQYPGAPGFEELAGRSRSELVRRAPVPAVPARDLYLGRHHLTVVRAVDRLRTAGFSVSLAIVSAGYGVLAEDELVVPYEASFAGLPPAEAVRRARLLGIRPRLAALAAGHEATVFLLSDAYLAATEAPVGGAPLELYVAVPGRALEGRGVVSVPCGRREARLLGASPRTAKAELFRRFAGAAADEGWPPALESLLAGRLATPAAPASAGDDRQLALFTS